MVEERRYRGEQVSCLQRGSAGLSQIPAVQIGFSAQ
jgi:hypothetical protein